ncbi:MAG: hypothetical protein COA60_007100 [Robiginitomaculum sp.]|nr:hypothetical protein [Robiginitomaculum sp.]
MKLTTTLLGASVLAILFAGASVAKEEEKTIKVKCEVKMIDGKVSKTGDCDEAKVMVFRGDGSDFKGQVQVMLDSLDGKGSHEMIIGSGRFPGLVKSKSFFLKDGNGFRFGDGGFGGLSGLTRLDGFFSPNMEWDTNDDGEVSKDEIKAAKAKEMSKYDKNRNRSLSLSEYENLWMAKQRNEMVDQFQDLDENGDGKVTEKEFAAKANHRAIRLIKIKKIVNMETDE